MRTEASSKRRNPCAWSFTTPSPPAPVLPQCSACCSELPPLPSETLVDLQQKEAEMNADKNADEEVRNVLVVVMLAVMLRAYACWGLASFLTQGGGRPALE